MREICFNLWYWLDARQRIFAIAATGYELDGEESDKCAVLLERSATEYESIAATALMEPIHYSELKRRGIESVYREELERIREGLGSDLPFPDDKLFCATPLYDFGQGYVPAAIGDGFIAERE